VLPQWHEDAAITRQYSTELPPGTTVYIGAARPQTTVRSPASGEVHSSGFDRRGYGEKVYLPRDLPENRVPLRFERDHSLRDRAVRNRVDPRDTRRATRPRPGGSPGVGSLDAEGVKVILVGSLKELRQGHLEHFAQLHGLIEGQLALPRLDRRDLGLRPAE